MVRSVTFHIFSWYDIEICIENHYISLVLALTTEMFI